MRGKDARPPKLLIDAAIKTFAWVHRVTPEDITGVTRRYAPVRARWDVWSRLHMLGYSPSAIGRAWGIDASSIRYGLHRARGLEACNAKAGGELRTQAA